METFRSASTTVTNFTFIYIRSEYLIPYNYTQISYIRMEYLISYNCVQIIRIKIFYWRTLNSNTRR